MFCINDRTWFLYTRNVVIYLNIRDGSVFIFICKTQEKTNKNIAPSAVHTFTSSLDRYTFQNGCCPANPDHYAKKIVHM